MILSQNIKFKKETRRWIRSSCSYQNVSPLPRALPLTGDLLTDKAVQGHGYWQTEYDGRGTLWVDRTDRLTCNFTESAVRSTATSINDRSLLTAITSTLCGLNSSGCYLVWFYSGVAKKNVACGSPSFPSQTKGCGAEKFIVEYPSKLWTLSAQTCAEDRFETTLQNPL